MTVQTEDSENMTVVRPHARHAGAGA